MSDVQFYNMNWISQEREKEEFKKSFSTLVAKVQYRAHLKRVWNPDIKCYKAIPKKLIITK